MNEIFEGLKEQGVDLDKVMKRFLGKEELYLRFLKRFPEDGNFQRMQEQFQQGNLEEAFKAAHTLKGLAANLGLDSIIKSVYPITEKLRAGLADGVTELMEEAGKEYQQIMEILSVS